jgi:hypothetical protein
MFAIPCPVAAPGMIVPSGPAEYRRMALGAGRPRASGTQVLTCSLRALDNRAGTGGQP